MSISKHINRISRKLNTIKLRRMYRSLFIFILMAFLINTSVLPPGDKTERVRQFTRMIEFDYINWMVNAALVKNAQSALSAQRYMTSQEQRKVVVDNLREVNRIDELNQEIQKIYADPQIKDPANQAAGLLAELKQMQVNQRYLAPLNETILQQQTASVAAAMGLTLGGQPIPPLLYHATQLPLALIISPRTKIVQDANISLLPDLTLDQITELEQRVEKSLNVSALVVNIGGVGVYPTMVMNTADLSWLLETIAHEWTHNFLTLRPLGLSYDASPELRTMNETTASISGREVSKEVIRKYYPELNPPPTPPASEETPAQPSQKPPEPPPFDFRKEMHTTRVNADALLAAGKIQEAEQFMEMRRQVFWDNGYLIRRLNQAYFAFNGAYADEAGGAAGEDPVGPAVRLLRKQSSSLADFLNRISWMSSFADLKKAVSH